MGTCPASRNEVPPMGRNLLSISYVAGPLEILAHKKVLRHMAPGGCRVRGEERTLG